MSDAPNSPLVLRAITRKLSVRVASRAARQAAGYIGLFGACAISTGAAGSLQLGINLAGSSSIVSGSAGSLAKTVNLSGTVSIVTGATGALSVSGQNPVAGSSAITTGATGSLLVVAALVGTSAATTSASGALVITKPLAGTSAITTGAAGSISIGGQNPIAGTSAAISGASGALVVAKPIAGTSAITTGAAGALALTIQIAGTSAATSGGVGDFSLINNLAGTSAVTTGAAGSISIGGQNPIAGTSAATSGASGALVVTKPLTGTSAITTGATGALSVSGGGSSAPAFMGASPAVANTGVSTLVIPNVSPTGSNRLLVVLIHTYKTSSPGVTAVNYNTSEALTKNTDASTSWGGGSSLLDVWYIKNPTVTTSGVEITFVAGTESCAAAAVWLSDVNQTTPFGTAAKNSTTATSISVSPSSALTDLMISALAYWQSLTITPGSGITVPTGGTSEQADAESIKVGYKTAASGTTTCDWSVSSSAELGTTAFAVGGI